MNETEKVQLFSIDKAMSFGGVAWSEVLSKRMRYSEIENPGS
jgi:hypothetical protein